jgi:hypothetical protein
MALSYQTFDVVYEHTTANSDTVRQNRATMTVYGGGLFKLKAEIERQRPSHLRVNILEANPR